MEAQFDRKLENGYIRYYYHLIQIMLDNDLKRALNVH